VRALIARDAKVIKIGNESVRVSTDAEKAEAERIIHDVKSKFGVTFDSMAAHKASLAKYPEAPEAQRTALAVRPWELDELKAIERALTHFAPVLGDARRKTMPTVRRRSSTRSASSTRRPMTTPRCSATGRAASSSGSGDVRRVRARARLADRRRQDREVATHEIAHGHLRSATRRVHEGHRLLGSEERQAQGGQRVEGRPTATPTGTRARTWPSRSCTSSSTPSG
jgi:hypothetical protein